MFIRGEFEDRFAVDRALVGELHVVALGGGTLGDIEFGALGAEAFDDLFDLGVGRIHGLDLGGNAGVVGQREGGAHVERDGHGGGFVGGDFTLLHVGDVEGLELGLLEAATVGLGEDLLLELFADLLAVTFDDHGRRGFARTETGEAGLLGNLADHGLVFGGDFGLVEGDDEAFTGFGDVFDFDVHSRKRAEGFIDRIGETTRPASARSMPDSTRLKAGGGANLMLARCRVSANCLPPTPPCC